MSLLSSSLHGPVLASFFKAAVLIAFCVLPSLPRRRWQRRISRRKASACMLGKMRLEAKDSCPQRRGNIWVSHFRDELESILTFWWRKQGSLWAHRQLMSGRIQDKKLTCIIWGAQKVPALSSPEFACGADALTTVQLCYFEIQCEFYGQNDFLWSKWVFMCSQSQQEASDASSGSRKCSHDALRHDSNLVPGKKWRLGNSWKEDTARLIQSQAIAARSR